MEKPTISNSYIEDLSPTDLTLLTQLLANTLPQHVSTTSWHTDQVTQIATLPPTFLRPKSVILPNLTPTSLCPTHHPLNPHLIHRLFLQISAECTIRLSRLTSSPEAGRYPMPRSVAEFLKRIQCLNALWMTREIFNAAFPSLGCSCDYVSACGDRREKGVQRVENGCEACVLAVVGGNRQMLVDLRSAMLGRKKKGRRERPVLWRVVEAWIMWTGEGEEIWKESEGVGKDVRRFRRVLQLMRRGVALPERYREKLREVDGEGQEGKDGEDEEGEEDDDGRYDFENEIIEYYRNLISTSTLALPLLDPNSISSQSETTIHPCFRDSVVFNPITGTFDRWFSAPPRPPNPSPSLLPPRQPNPTPTHFWNNSTTTISSFNSRTATSTANFAHTAQKRAQSYKKLVGMSSIDSLGRTMENLLTANKKGGDKFRYSSSPTMDDDGNRATLWDDFYKREG